MVRNTEIVEKIRRKAVIKNSLEIAMRILKYEMLSYECVAKLVDLNVDDLKKLDHKLKSSEKLDIDPIVDEIYEKLEEDINNTNPCRLIEYLNNHDWIKVDRNRKNIVVFQKTVECGKIQRNYQVTIPLVKNLFNYQNTMQIAIGIISEADHCTEKELCNIIKNL